MTTQSKWPPPVTHFLSHHPALFSSISLAHRTYPACLFANLSVSPHNLRAGRDVSVLLITTVSPLNSAQELINQYSLKE